MVVFLFCENMNLEIEVQFSVLVLERLPATSTSLCPKHWTVASYIGFQEGKRLDLLGTISPNSPLAEKSKR